MLTPRQQMILSVIVEDYVRSAEPVGSRTLSKHANIQFSAATIRNEMSDLEDQGFLDQPHTSAGRIPSQKGYRFYVDNLMHGTEIDPASVETLRELFRQRIAEFERVIAQTSTVLSQLTQYTSIVLGPKMYEEKVKRIELVPLGKGHAVAILVTETGHVHDRQVMLSEGISPEDVQEIVRALNAKLSGVPLYHLKSRIYREVSNEMANTLERYEDALAVLEEVCKVEQTPSDRVYVGGATNILAQPEFRNVDKVRPLLAMLESTQAAVQMLPVGTIGVQVRIGEENTAAALQDCAVISTTYTFGGRPVGQIGVLGPTRMDYARVVKILDYASKNLSRVLSKGPE